MIVAVFVLFKKKKKVIFFINEIKKIQVDSFLKVNVSQCTNEFLLRDDVKAKKKNTKKNQNSCVRIITLHIEIESSSIKKHRTKKYKIKKKAKKIKKKKIGTMKNVEIDEDENVDFFLCAFFFFLVS